MDELEAKIARLERKLEREKSARSQAEQLLETKSQELYESNQSLLQQVNDARLQQQQLEFLTGLSADTWVDSNINQLTTKFLDRASEFLMKTDAVFLKVAPQKLVQVELSNHIAKSKTSQIIDFCHSLDCKKLIAKFQQDGTESNLIDTSEFSDIAIYTMGLFVPIYSVSNLMGMAVFLYQQNEDVDILKLQTIESARSMLSSAAQRRLAANRLSSKYKELQDTYNKLEQVQQQLVQSEKMASLGQLAAGVAHEINNPIGYVLSNYQTLSEYLEVVNQMFDYANSLIETPNSDNLILDKINTLWQEEDVDFIRDDLAQLMDASHKGLARVQDIVAGLKSFSHADPDKLEAVDIAECVDDALQIVWNELKYDITLDKNYSPTRQIKANSGQLQQVFVNLFVNAKQAMENSETKILSLSIRQDDKWIEIVVADTGCGIEQQSIKKLFTPFFTTKPVGVGTGLGLSISFGIVQNHNGTIEVTSEIGKGTQFILRFPALSASN